MGKFVDITGHVIFEGKEIPLCVLCANKDVSLSRMKYRIYKQGLSVEDALEAAKIKRFWKPKIA